MPAYMIIMSVTTTMFVAMFPNTDKLCFAGEVPGGDGGAVLQATVEAGQGLKIILGVTCVVFIYLVK